MRPYIAITLLLLIMSARMPVRAETNTTVTPAVTYVHVDGNASTFREHEWMTDKWSGGIEEFLFTDKLKNDWEFRLEGRALVQMEDYKLELQIRKPETGFLRAGFTQYRKYSDDTGGFFSLFSPSSFQLGSDLHLDIGSFYIEAGLDKPDLPKLTLGYERHFQEGTKSSLQWGSVTDTANTRKIYPAWSDTDDTTDIIRLSVAHTIKNIEIENEFRYERFQTDSARYTTSTNLVTATGKTVTVRESYDHDSFFNTLHLSSHFNEKVFWSFGHLYNRVNGDGGLQVITPPPLAAFDRNWAANVLNLESDTHVLNANVLLGPFAHFLINLGLQAQTIESDGLTVALLTEGLNPTVTSNIISSNQQDSLREFLGIRYTRIPWTTLYAEAQWTQLQGDLYEIETRDNATGFVRQTDTDVLRQDYTVGFNTAPIRRVTLAGRYRHRIHENDYDHNLDTELGYPAFILAQDFVTDEVMSKLTYRPFNKLSIALSYQLVATDIDTTTQSLAVFVPGGKLRAGNYDANIYSLSVTVTPFSRLYVTGVASYLDTRTRAFANDLPEIVTYRGDTLTLIGAAGYALDEKTDLTIQYTFSRADNYTDNAASGLPLGMDYDQHGLIVGLARKFTNTILAQIRYGFYRYDNQVDNRTDYTAHLAAASCTIRF